MLLLLLLLLYYYYLFFLFFRMVNEQNISFSMCWLSNNMCEGTCFWWTFGQLEQANSGVYGPRMIRTLHLLSMNFFFWKLIRTIMPSNMTLFGHPSPFAPSSDDDDKVLFSIEIEQLEPLYLILKYLLNTNCYNFSKH